MAGQPDQWAGLSAKAMSKLLTASQFEKIKRGAEMVAKGKVVAQSKRAIRTPPRPSTNEDQEAVVATITTIGKQLDEVMMNVGLEVSARVCVCVCVCVCARAFVVVICRVVTFDSFWRCIIFVLVVSL